MGRSRSVVARGYDDKVHARGGTLSRERHNLSAPRLGQLYFLLRSSVRAAADLGVSMWDLLYLFLETREAVIRMKIYLI